MTVEETNNLLALAKVNYGYVFKQMSKAEKVMLVKSWAFVLQDIPADIATLAFMQLLASSKWLPTPAEIRGQVRRLYFSAANYGLDGTMELDDENSARVRAYIESKTSHLRSDGGEELSLDVILSKGYGKDLGTGKQEFQRIENKEE